MADRVGIIDHGRLIVEGAPRELIDQMGADVLQVAGTGNTKAFVAAVNALPFVKDVTAGNGLIQIGVDSGNRRLVQVVSAASESDFRIEDISYAKPSLGDVYLKYTGHQLRDR